MKNTKGEQIKMLGFLDLIDVTDSAAQDLKASISLLNLIKDDVYTLTEIPEQVDVFDVISYKQRAIRILSALDGFELSVEYVSHTLSKAAQDAEESRGQQ